MDKHKWEPDRKGGNPDKAYHDELNDRGSSLSDTPSESEARDKAKIEKVLSGQGQKIDTAAPDELEEDNGSDGSIGRETLEKK